MQHLPRLSFLRVGAGGDHAVYSLVKDEAHTNVAFLFGEEDRRLPDEDVLTVTRGYLGSYPNFVFDVEAAEIEAFAAALTAVRSEADFTTVAERFGVRRTSPRFWGIVDWLHEDFRRRQPTEAGLFDLARYGNF